MSSIEGKVALVTGAGQGIEAGSGQFHLFISQQAAHQLGARVGGFFVFQRRGLRQQQARFDFDQHRRHQ